MIEFVVVALVVVVLLALGGVGGFSLAQALLPDQAARALKENRELRTTMRSLPRASLVDPEDMICGCEHHRAFHDPKTGLCAGKDYLPQDRYSSLKEWKKCQCRQYVGPVEAPESSSPEPVDPLLEEALRELDE